MNDKELADAVVALGVGNYNGTTMYFYGRSFDAIPEFVRDWRVAGALMEKAQSKPDYLQFILDKSKISSQAAHRVWAYEDLDGGSISHARNESLPRAIAEACCEALKK